MPATHKAHGVAPSISHHFTFLNYVLAAEVPMVKPD